MNYNYYEEMKEDVRNYLKNTDERDYNSLYDAMFISDEITGNGSGSYTFSTYQAEENLCHNMNLLREAAEEFGDDLGALIERGAENLRRNYQMLLIRSNFTRSTRRIGGLKNGKIYYIF